MYKLLLLVASASAIQIDESAGYRCDGSVHPWCKKASSSTWNTPDWKINYKVPSFGVDPDIKATQGHIKSAEKKLKQTFTASFEKPKSHPMGYTVPNFGIDKEIKDATASIASTEKKLGAWTPK